MSRLKYLFVHTTGEGVWNTHLDRFKQTISDAAGASVGDVFERANVSFITDSQAGETVQATKAFPSQEIEQMTSFYPELADRNRFSFHNVVYECEPNKYGLLIFVYDLTLG